MPGTSIAPDSAYRHRAGPSRRDTMATPNQQQNDPNRKPSTQDDQKGGQKNQTGQDPKQNRNPSQNPGPRSAEQKPNPKWH